MLDLSKRKLFVFSFEKHFFVLFFSGASYRRNDEISKSDWIRTRPTEKRKRNSRSKNSRISVESAERRFSIDSFRREKTRNAESTFPSIRSATNDGKLQFLSVFTFHRTKFRRIFKFRRDRFDRRISSIVGKVEKPKSQSRSDSKMRLGIGDEIQQKPFDRQWFVWSSSAFFLVESQKTFLSFSPETRSATRNSLGQSIFAINSKFLCFSRIFQRKKTKKIQIRIFTFFGSKFVEIFDDRLKIGVNVEKNQRKRRQSWKKINPTFVFSLTE